MRNKGFTLFELLLVITAFSIILMIAVPFSNSSVVRGNLETSSRLVESSLRRTYIYARSGENNSDWGTRITGTDVTVFSGSSFNDRNPALDEVSNMPSTVTLDGDLENAGVVDIIFTKNSGIPNEAQIGNFTLTAGQDVRTITINGKGAVSITK